MSKGGFLTGLRPKQSFFLLRRISYVPETTGSWPSFKGSGSYKQDSRLQGGGVSIQKLYCRSYGAETRLTTKRSISTQTPRQRPPSFPWRRSCNPRHANSSNMASHADRTLRVVNFNVLAPSARLCKPFDTKPWLQRHQAICDTLKGLNPDVVCIQEFDFHPKTTARVEGSPTELSFKSLYEANFGDRFHLHALKRTGDKPEGVGMLIRKERFEDVTVTDYDLRPRTCNRVAQIARMRDKYSGRTIVLGNTHLTVAHVNNYDIPKNRPMQMQQVLDYMNANTDRGNELLLVCADMNCDHLETEPPQRQEGAPNFTTFDVSKPVHMAFEDGYSSLYHKCNPEIKRPISHTSSYTQDGCCDYIFCKDLMKKDGQKLGAQYKDAFLYPAEIHPEHAWDPYTGWSHSLDWSITMSDHRPLVVDLLVPKL
eukprot:m.342898 g.342898  ORF g.342898 m.342898 type:complete len:425 (-) comp22005_c0_seq1:223-1497(-)